MQPRYSHLKVIRLRNFLTRAKYSSRYSRGTFIFRPQIGVLFLLQSNAALLFCIKRTPLKASRTATPRIAINPKRFRNSRMPLDVFAHALFSSAARMSFADIDFGGHARYLPQLVS
jgi:hypothetical protein